MSSSKKPANPQNDNAAKETFPELVEKKKAGFNQYSPVEIFPPIENIGKTRDKPKQITQLIVESEPPQKILVQETFPELVEISNGKTRDKVAQQTGIGRAKEQI